MSLHSVTGTSLSGLAAATVSLDLAAHNLANVQTAGFKSSHPVFATQPQMLGGVMVAGITTDRAQGPVSVNDQPPLLALDGEGLFILEGAHGERLYTRDGHFSLNGQGELITSGGQRVLGYAAGDDGVIDSSRLVPLKLGSRGYNFGRDGRIVGRSADGRQRTLGQLRIARFPNPQGLVQRPGNTLRASPASGLPLESNPDVAGAAAVIPGSTELSNVDIGRELVDVTLASNAFRANLLVLETADSLLGELFFPWPAR